MQHLSDELLIPPTPLVALLSDAPFRDALASSLRSCSGGGFRIKYEAAALAGVRFPAKQRTHNEHEYASYVPQGILRANWVEKHHNLLPAVLVRLLLAGVVGGGVGVGGGTFLRHAPPPPARRRAR
jgi:hypothetical protein